MFTTLKNTKIKNTSESLGRFLRGRERMVHVSALIIDHPLFAHAVHVGTAATYQGPRYMVGSTHTRHMGRNLHKRKRREALIRIAGSVRVARRGLAQTRAASALQA